MVAKQLCKYCGVTDDQVKNASNQKVKEYRKTGNTDLIHYTTVIPNDLKRWKIILYTVLLGWLGINHYYINRPVRATFSLVSTISSIGIMFLGLLIKISTRAGKIAFNIFYEIFFYMMAINVVLWVLDIFGVIFKSFKMPVVLPKKEEIKWQK
jgi:hypothetical protein